MYHYMYLKILIFLLVLTMSTYIAIGQEWNTYPNAGTYTDVAADMNTACGMFYGNGTLVWTINDAST